MPGAVSSEMLAGRHLEVKLSNEADWRVCIPRSMTWGGKGCLNVCSKGGTLVSHLAPEQSWCQSPANRAGAQCTEWVLLASGKRAARLQGTHRSAQEADEATSARSWSGCRKHPPWKRGADSLKRLSATVSEMGTTLGQESKSKGLGYAWSRRPHGKHAARQYAARP